MSVKNSTMRIIGLAIGVILALIDSTVLPIVKKIHTGELDQNYIIVAMFIYALAPLIFLMGLNYASLTVMNITWDLASDVFVTFIGLVILREGIGVRSAFGLIFAVISILLLLSDDNSDKVLHQSENTNTHKT